MSDAEKIKVLTAALEAAYTRFGDFAIDWPGRFGPGGQALLIKMRNALALATGRTEQDVQDDYGTRAHKARLSAAGNKEA